MSRLVAAAAALALLAGCEAVQRLQNHKVMAAVVIRSPEVGVPALGVNPVAVTTAQLFFGDRQDSTSQPPTGLSGATVVLEWTGSAPGQVTLPPAAAAGWYQAVSAAIPYEPNARYTFTVTHAGETFSGSVEAPSPPAIQEVDATTHLFPPQFVAAFQKQTVTRSGSDIAFYEVSPVAGGTLAPPTCTNAPLDDAGALIELLIAPGAWQVPSFDLWRTDLTQTAQQKCFAPAGSGVHLVSLTTLRQGSQLSSNLFLGSGVLAGASDAGVLVLQ